MLITFCHGQVCLLDPPPGSLMKNCVDVLLPIVTDIVNCSLESHTVPHVMKEALVRPIFKKSSLDHEQMKNYRPISNLPFIAKCCEKVVADQLSGKQHLAFEKSAEDQDKFVMWCIYSTFHNTSMSLTISDIIWGS